MPHPVVRLPHGKQRRGLGVGAVHHFATWNHPDRLRFQRELDVQDLSNIKCVVGGLLSLLSRHDTGKNRIKLLRSLFPDESAR